ncbi:methyl-accepting chemotaxis protein [Fulvimonas sp. R45]|uniref:methyl-accepting chemotaxis protein n=1 Tax=Fulvimonas sp. R45 TaxID=3045937 RepID=UPI00265FEE76|nr:methyl-accepting chemotaxis protein [Fulvimonas sp. R45]MDO1530411.1 methyl-accepting chemotaxis protein [Fulvimonas sp. R45]
MKMPKLKFKISALTVRGRLRLVLGMLVLMLIGGAAVGLGSLQVQSDNMRLMYDEEIVPAQLVSQLAQRSLMSFLVLGEASSVVAKPDQLKQKLAESGKYRDAIAALRKQIAGLAMDGDVAKQYRDFASTDADYDSAVKDMLDALKQADPGSGDVLEMEVRPLMMQRQDALGKVVDLQRVAAQRVYDTQLKRFRVVRAASVAALVAGLALALFMALALSRYIVDTLRFAGRVARAISEGRLGHDIKAGRRDELGDLLDAFRTMDERLAAIVGEVRHGAGAVSTAAQQIARGNDDLSQRTQEQASSLEQTASSMEQMTSTVKQNAENASHANQLARGAREQAERGGEVVAQAVGAMREINQSSGRIADIVGLIDEIAFQTNLLSLNAAVEAARAGEQGRGFAVVAAEVRNLAQRSAGAAKEIKALIKDSVDKVQAGSTLVDQSGKALADIVESVKKVTDIVAEIAAASQEQSAGIDQVNHAVLQMDEMTQQNAALVEEAAAAARSMQEQAAELSGQVGFFELGGRAAEPAPRPSTAVAEAEAVFAAVRNAPPRAAREPETADAGAWKEF